MVFYARVVGYEADYVAMIFLFRICCLVKLVIKLAGNYNKYRCWLERTEAEVSIRHAGRDVGIEVIQGAGVSIGVKSRFKIVSGRRYELPLLFLS